MKLKDAPESAYYRQVIFVDNLSVSNSAFYPFLLFPVERCMYAADKTG